MGSVTLCRLGRVLVPDGEVGLGVLPRVVGLGSRVARHVHVELGFVRIEGVEDADHADLEGVRVVGGAAAAARGRCGRELAHGVVCGLLGLVGGLLEGLVLGVAVGTDAAVGGLGVPRRGHVDAARGQGRQEFPAGLLHLGRSAALGGVARVARAVVGEADAHGRFLPLGLDDDDVADANNAGEHGREQGVDAGAVDGCPLDVGAVRVGVAVRHADEERARGSVRVDAVG